MSGNWRWWHKYGSWWAIQYGLERIEIGVHVEPFTKVTNSGVKYGPYIDIHLPFVTLSFGRNPIYAGELHLKTAIHRGGLNANDH